MTTEGIEGHPMRVAVTGAGGFVGAHLVALLQRKYDVVALGRGELSAAGLSSTTPSPDVVVHLAAATAPGWCEAHPVAAREANVELTRRLSRQARLRVRRFVYASTDLVFDGEKGSYTEADPPRPTSVYGRSKLEGERVVFEELGGRALVARLPLMYGPRRSTTSRESFAEAMLRRGRAGESVRLFADEYRTPLYVEDAAEHLAWLVDAPIEVPLLHLGGPERCSRHEMGVVAFDVFGIPKDLAEAASRSDDPSTADRPEDVSLDSELARRIGVRSRGLREGFAKFRDTMAKT